MNRQTCLKIKIIRCEGEWVCVYDFYTLFAIAINPSMLIRKSNRQLKAIQRAIQSILVDFVSSSPDQKKRILGIASNTIDDEFEVEAHDVEEARTFETQTAHVLNERYFRFFSFYFIPDIISFIIFFCQFFSLSTSKTTLYFLRVCT